MKILKIILPFIITAAVVSGFFFTKDLRAYICGTIGGFAFATLIFTMIGHRQLKKAQQSLDKAIRDQIISNQYADEHDVDSE